MTKQMLVLTTLLLYVFLCSFIIEPGSLGVTKYVIEDNALQGIRVAFASDFHLKPKQYKRLDRVIRTINREQPDIVLLGGDILTGHDPKDTMKFNTIVRKLSMIQAPTFAVFGENDWWAGGDDFLVTMRTSRIRILRNSSSRLVVRRRYVDIIGLDDITVKEADIPKAFYGTRAPRLVMSHNPDVYYDIPDTASLMFAGHTHGGQFRFPLSPALFVASKYGSAFSDGYLKPMRLKLIITRGIGVSGIPARFNCKPEIVIVDFVKTGSPNISNPKIKK